MRGVALLLLLVLVAPAGAAVTPEERETLVSALRVLRVRYDPDAALAASQVLDGPALLEADAAGFLGGVFAEAPLTVELGRFLGDRALLREAPPERRRSLQAALARAAVRETDDTLRARLPGRFGPDFVADTTRFEHLTRSMALLGRIAFEGELAPETRLELYGRLRELVAAHPGVLRADARIDPTAQPRLAAVRAQLQKNLQDLLVPFQPERFLADTGFTGDHAELVRNHGVLMLDAGGLDARQRRAVREVLALVPPELHRTRHVSVHELLGNVDGGRIVVPLAGSLGVNLYGMSVGSHRDNNFPADVAPAPVPVFCSVVQHEINHMVDAHAIAGDPALRERRDELIARAGHDPRQYLRSMFEPGFFVSHPQEFFASIANAWFSDSFRTLALARRRLAEGYVEPIQQLLFFAEVYSRGRDSVPFVVQDANCEFSLHPVPVGRGARGRIDRLELPDGTLRFRLDESGNLVR